MSLLLFLQASFSKIQAVVLSLFFLIALLFAELFTETGKNDKMMPRQLQISKVAVIVKYILIIIIVGLE